MGARYATAGFQTPIASAYKTIVELLGGTTGRFKLYDVLIGQSGTPSDSTVTHGLIRITASGTGTAIVPVPLDPADVAASVAAEEDSTGEGTTTGIHLIEIPINVRASYRWVASPNSEIVVAAVANEGLSWRAKSPAFILQAEATLFHEE